MGLKSLSILEYEKLGRFSESGYGKMFAYDSSSYNTIIDTRVKAKMIREKNPNTWDDLKNIYYSGPTVFAIQKQIMSSIIIKADIKSAYPAYLINEEIKKPGTYRIKYDGAAPLTDNVTLYEIKFNCSIHNNFVNWFLNSHAIQKKRVQTDGSNVWGTISIFSSYQMNLMKYVNYFLPEGAIVLRSWVFIGPYTMANSLNKQQIVKMYKSKEEGHKDSKMELNASTGWLKHIDAATYFHMVQYIKYHLLKTVYDYDLEDYLVGVQTDCLYYELNNETDNIPWNVTLDKVTLSGVDGLNIGHYKFEQLNVFDLFVQTKRITTRGE